MAKQHPNLRFAKMMVERINLAQDISEIQCWKHDTRNVYKDYPYGRKLVLEAIARVERRIVRLAHIREKFGAHGHKVW